MRTKTLNDGVEMIIDSAGHTILSIINRLGFQGFKLIDLGVDDITCGDTTCSEATDIFTAEGASTSVHIWTIILPLDKAKSYIFDRLYLKLSKAESEGGDIAFNVYINDKLLFTKTATQVEGGPNTYTVDEESLRNTTSGFPGDSIVKIELVSGDISEDDTLEYNIILYEAISGEGYISIVSDDKLYNIVLYTGGVVTLPPGKYTCTSFGINVINLDAAPE